MGKPEGKRYQHLEDLGACGRIKWKLILNKSGKRGGLDLSGSGQDQMAGFFYTIMNLSVFIKR